MDRGDIRDAAEPLRALLNIQALDIMWFQIDEGVQMKGFGHETNKPVPEASFSKILKICLKQCTKNATKWHCEVIWEINKFVS